MNSRGTVLVADDDYDLRRGLGLRLRANGYTVIEAADGLTALARSRGQSVDAVILDHGMPMGEGRSITEVIRRTNDVPIIFATGHDRADFEQLVLHGRDIYFLSKPIDEQQLLRLLESVIAKGAPAA